MSSFYGSRFYEGGVIKTHWRYSCELPYDLSDIDPESRSHCLLQREEDIFQSKQEFLTFNRSELEINDNSLYKIVKAHHGKRHKPMPTRLEVTLFQ